jgi:hypothetical protein
MQDRLSRRTFLGDRGVPPTDACVETLWRAVELGAASLYPGEYAAHHGRTATLRDSAHLFEKPT